MNQTNRREKTTRSCFHLWGRFFGYAYFWATVVGWDFHLAVAAANPPPSGLAAEDTMMDIHLLLINGDSPFFEPVIDGWKKACQDYGITCHFVPPRIMEPPELAQDSCQYRADLVHGFLTNSTILSNASSSSKTVRRAIIMRPCGGNDDANRAMIQDAWDEGVPVITFDGDTPDSKRVAFVGTDNVFMGRTMARLLRQLRPGGGTFAIIGAITGRYEGFIDEIYKDNHREDRAHWDPVEVDVPESVDDPSLSFMEQMEIYAPYNPTAFVIMKQTPMRHENWTQFIDKHRHRNITFIGTDGSDYQLDYLNRRYVDGLVGQLPHEFGTESIKVMYQYLTTYKLDKDFYPTNVVAYNLIPLDLPPLQMDENLLGDLRFVGYTFFGIIICSAITCVSWTISNRKAVVVNAAQPSFLVTVATGVMIMSSTLIPLSFDDGGEAEAHSESFNVGICMSIPWLASVGFTVTFAALFSKTWRVNRIFLSDNSHARVTVSEMDVLAPFLLLLTCNIIVLVCWTVIDPLSYERREYDGTDYWNRVLASYGACTSDSVGYYVMPLAFINFSVLLIACYQAYRARNIESEFSESKYIGLTMFSLCQAFMTGIPIVTLVRDTPEVFYLVLALAIFVICMVVLGLIFLPKYLKHREYMLHTEASQRRLIAQSVLRSTVGATSVLRKSTVTNSDSSIGAGSYGISARSPSILKRHKPSSASSTQESVKSLEDELGNNEPGPCISKDDKQCENRVQAERADKKRVSFAGPPPSAVSLLNENGTSNTAILDGESSQVSDAVSSTGIEIGDSNPSSPDANISENECSELNASDNADRSQDDELELSMAGEESGDSNAVLTNGEIEVKDEQENSDPPTEKFGD